MFPLVLDLMIFMIVYLFDCFNYPNIHFFGKAGIISGPFFFGLMKFSHTVVVGKTGIKSYRYWSQDQKYFVFMKYSFISTVLIQLVPFILASPHYSQFYIDQWSLLLHHSWAPCWLPMCFLVANLFSRKTNNFSFFELFQKSPAGIISSCITLPL